MMQIILFLYFYQLLPAFTNGRLKISPGFTVQIFRPHTLNIADFWHLPPI